MFFQEGLRNELSLSEKEREAKLSFFILTVLRNSESPLLEKERLHLVEMLENQQFFPGTALGSPIH